MKYKIDSDQSRDVVLKIISRLPLDKPYQITVDNYVENHSRDQENKFHAMIGDLADEFNKKDLGYTREDVKAIVKYKLGLYKEIKGKAGDIVLVYEHTHGRSKQFYADLIEQTYQLAAEWGILLQ